MKTTISQKIKLGGFTLLGILILIGGIFSIGSKKNMFSRNFLIFGMFKNISGLQVGNVVRFAGINIGSVTSINIENDTTIRIGMRLKEKVHPFLKKDAMASIGTDGLMGDKLVNISPGFGKENRLLEHRGYIRTVNPVEFDKIINRISNVADNAEMITSSLANISKQINSGKGSIGRLIYSDSLERGIEGTVKSAHETIKSAHATLNTVHEAAKSAHETIDKAQVGVESFNQNMEAMKHNILLKGYYKKQARRQAKEREKGDAKEQEEENGKKR
jgi:phospholipid/cholesterol/gamma-HCH transport system substrate-binding protein